MKSVIAIITLSVIFNDMVCQAADTVKIAAVGAKTGDAAQSYREFFPAMQFTVDELNQQGGLLGKQIELLEYDNKSTSLGSKLAAQKAVEAGVIGVIGAFWSSHSLSMAPVLQDAHIPMISPLSTNPDVTLVGDYIFRVCFIDPFQGTVMANFAFNDLKARTAILVTQAGEPYSMGLGQFFKEQFTKNGGKILWEESYLGGTADFSPIVKQIGLLKPSVVFLPGFARESGFMIKQTKNAGISTIFLGGDGWSNEMIEYCGDAIDGNYFSHHWHHDSMVEKNRQLVKKYELSPYANQNNFRGAGFPLTYDALHVFADAVTRAKSFDPSLIRDALSITKDYEGSTGRISFNQNRDPVKSAVILKFENKNVVYAKTIEP